MLTPLAAKVAKRVGAVDFPDFKRKIHTHATPYGGGLAMYASFWVSYLVAHFSSGAEFSIKLLGMFIAAMAVLLIGLFDDIKPIPAKYKFLVHLIAAGILYYVGFRISYFTWIGGKVVSLGIWSIPLTIIWIAGVTNTINLIDGLDGLAAGIASIASITIFVISFITGNTGAAMLAAILAGACAGFLPQNLAMRKKVFMGDAGSYFVGIILSVISMEGGLKSATVLTIVVPVLAVGLPIFDTAFAIIRRLFSGQPIGEPDRGHIHHRLVSMGMGVRKAVLAMFFINVVFGMAAVAFMDGDWPYGLMFLFIALVMLSIPVFNGRGRRHEEEPNEGIRYKNYEELFGSAAGSTGAAGGAASATTAVGAASFKLPTVLVVFGTRPETIKMAPLVAKMKQKNSFRTIVCVTGQHREQMDQMLEVFELEPDIDLNLMRRSQSLADITRRTLKTVDEVIRMLKPSMVMVHGDPTASYAAAVAAFYNEVSIAHVEAGLRSGNIHSPFPEEYNRRSTGMLADLHFAATEQNKKTLLSEGVSEDKIYVTGNTAIDAVFSMIDPDYEFEDEALRAVISKIEAADAESEEGAKTRVIVMTAHRRENLGDRMRDAFKAVRRIADEHEDIHIIYPVHLNPAVGKVADEVLGGHERISLIKPLAYRDMCNLMSRCYLVLTDSGGLQEEAPALGKPVILMRTETERQEAVDAGTVLLSGVSESGVYDALSRLLGDEGLYASMSSAENPYGDGHTSERIADILDDYFRSGMKKMIRIAVDGPSGSGKSTVSKIVAKRLGISYLDTGAMYRTVAALALKKNVDASDESALCKMMREYQAECDGFKNLPDSDIRTPEVNNVVSEVSSHKNVRILLTEIQQDIASKNSVIMDGRDIGTTVMPKAELKIYLDASPEERARRRALESGEDYESVLESIKRRDHLDSTREYSPLAKADDAVVIDTEGITAEQVADRIVALAEKI